MSPAFFFSLHGALSITSSVCFSTLFSSISITLLRPNLFPMSTSHCRATYRLAKSSHFDPQGTCNKSTISSIAEFSGGREGRNVKHGWYNAHGAKPNRVYALSFQYMLYLLTLHDFYILSRSFSKAGVTKQRVYICWSLQAAVQAEMKTCRDPIGIVFSTIAVSSLLTATAVRLVYQSSGLIMTCMFCFFFHS